ncbi:uncharacterized protein [Ptychodera flava]|uniref:uncharacterized protein n=1 Tax=Ptychodera flava TaxID=63121 RepID=UPI00396A4872
MATGELPKVPQRALDDDKIKDSTDKHPVSGSYHDVRTKGKIFELRVDVDKLSKYSPVLNVISGELIENGQIEVYFKSSEVKKKEDGNLIGYGNAISGGRQVPTAFSVSIKYLDGDWTAEITLRQLGIAHKCVRYSKFFRHVTVDIDYSGSDELLLPIYNTSSHPERAVDGDREITVFSVLEDAGIEITNSKATSNKVYDPEPSTPWTNSELYEVMATHHDKDPSRWNVWILLAPHYINPDLLGLMFDSKNRKGCAVFTGHLWFQGLDSQDSQIKATAQRRLLHTIVHEIGHSFNLWHSFLKGKPDSLSFMNYEHIYNIRNGKDSYFKNFLFSFDDEEIRFLRHGPVNWVQPGVSPFLMHSPQLNMPEKSKDKISQRLKFTLKPNKVRYMQMEVVRLELKLKNMHNQVLEVESKLDPTAGWVTIYISDPNGTVKAVDSLTSGSVTYCPKELYPPQSKDEADRISEVVPLVYGTKGFYFKEAGDYSIQAVYLFGNYNVVTEPVEITIKEYKGEPKIFNKFFTDRVGEFIALGGSSSMRYEETKWFITKELASSEDCKELALEIAALCYRNFAYSSRKALSIGTQSLKVEKEDPKVLADEVLESTKQAIDHLHSQGEPVDNIFYRRLAVLRAACHLRKTQPSEAQADKEVNRMIADLESRNVKGYVIHEMKVEWKKRLDDYRKPHDKGRSANSGPTGQDSVQI